MKKIVEQHEEMLPEYDFSHGVRGKYYKRYLEAHNIVAIEPDLREFFPTAESVNRALRQMVRQMKARSKTGAEPSKARAI